MSFKFTVQTVVAAISAFATAFGSAYYAAASNATPGVQGSEWIGVVLAAVTAAVATFYHDPSVK